MTLELSVVVPCYNEAGNIPGLLERYRPLTKDTALELVLVDNGSSDGTGEAIDRELAKPENSFARKAVVERNIGYGYGLQVGLETSIAPVTAISHADLQCPPEDCVAALKIYREKVKDGPCLIKGRRRGARPFLDRCVTWFYNHLAVCVLGLRVHPVEGGGTRPPDLNAEPKLFDRALIRDLAHGPKDFTYDMYALHLAHTKGWRIYEFDVGYETRQWGKSKLAANPWVRFKTSLNALVKMFQFRRDPAAKRQIPRA
ncbi:MAG: glycosyltransferase family 2 protein [Elusimicrobiota bacterium]